MKMGNRLTSVLISLAVILVIFAVIMFVFGTQTLGPFNFSVDQATLLLRFVFVIIGLLIAFAVYLATRDNAAWEVGTREVVWMAIGAALRGLLLLFNGTVFVVPSLSQVSLRPAIAIPMFFGYAFGPVVGFFTGASGTCSVMLYGLWSSPVEHREWPRGFISVWRCCSRTRRGVTIRSFGSAACWPIWR
jgi:hypothetical protein